jgi:hypothetical protein
MKEHGMIDVPTTRVAFSAAVATAVALLLSLIIQVSAAQAATWPDCNTICIKPGSLTATIAKPRPHDIRLRTYWTAYVEKPCGFPVFVGDCTFTVKSWGEVSWALQRHTRLHGWKTVATADDVGVSGDQEFLFAGRAGTYRGQMQVRVTHFHLYSTTEVVTTPKLAVH